MYDYQINPFFGFKRSVYLINFIPKPSQSIRDKSWTLKFIMFIDDAIFSDINNRMVLEYPHQSKNGDKQQRNGEQVFWQLFSTFYTLVMTNVLVSSPNQEYRSFFLRL